MVIRCPAAGSHCGQLLGEADTRSRETCGVPRAGRPFGHCGTGRGASPGAGDRRERVDAHRRLPGAPALEPVQRRRPLRARPARRQRPGDEVLDRAAHRSLRRGRRAHEERRPARGLLPLQDRGPADQRARPRGHRLPDRARLRHLQARPQDRPGARLHEGERQRRERVLADLLEGQARAYGRTYFKKPLEPDILRQGRDREPEPPRSCRPAPAAHRPRSPIRRSSSSTAPGWDSSGATRRPRAPARRSRPASTSSAATTTSSTSASSG